MKHIFVVVAAYDINSFNTLVNEKLALGYKFLNGSPMIISPCETVTGRGLQYSIPMLLEEEV